jgi:hypothetical protein
MIIKPVVGWGGYFVTDTGKVLSTRRTRKQIVMNPFLAGLGYPVVALRDGTNATNFYVHRLVLAAFRGDRPTSTRSRHIDGDIRNNHLDNLKWDAPKVIHLKLTEAEKTVARFHDGYTPVTECGCWLWERTTDKHGYGEFKIPGKTRKAHRASWILHHGDIPVGLSVLHKCDNPSCVNPHHLFIGTGKDNSMDRVAKGRYIGEHSAQAKLSTKDVWEIKQVHPYYARTELASFYGVSDCTIRDIIFGRNWTHVNI